MFVFNVKKNQKLKHSERLNVKSFFAVGLRLFVVSGLFFVVVGVVFVTLKRHFNLNHHSMITGHVFDNTLPRLEETVFLADVATKRRFELFQMNKVVNVPFDFVLESFRANVALELRLFGVDVILMLQNLFNNYFDHYTISVKNNDYVPCS